MEMGSGAPLDTREIAAIVIRHKECDSKDPVLRHAVANHLVYVLAKAVKWGAVSSPRYEKGLRRWSQPAG